MTRRLLPPDEWPKLAGTELETVWPVLDREKARVMVVEDGGQIVACWSMFPVFHVEGVWLHPDYRGHVGVVGKLLGFMRQLAHAAGVKSVMTGCLSSNVADYLDRIGAVPLEGRQYVIPIGDR